MSLKNKIKEASLGVAEKVKDADIQGKLSELKDGVSGIIENAGEKLDNITGFSLPVLLASEGYYKKVVDYLNETYHIHNENPAIQEVMDSLAHAKGYGGAAFHRIADGRHSITGAWESVSKAYPDMETGEKIKGIFGHLWSDFHSRVGVALFSFDNHESFKEFCDSLHLSPKLVQDLFTVNSTELIGTSLSVIPTLFRLNEMEATDFARVASRLGILTAIGQGQFEAVSGVFSLVMLGKSFYMAKTNGLPVTDIFQDCWVEGGFTAVTLGMTQLLPIPFNLVVPFLIVGLKNSVHEHGLQEGFVQYHDGLQEQMISLKEGIQEIDFDQYKESVVDWLKQLDSSDIKDMFTEQFERIRIKD